MSFGPASPDVGPQPASCFRAPCMAKLSLGPCFSGSFLGGVSPDLGLLINVLSLHNVFFSEMGLREAKLYLVL